MGKVKPASNGPPRRSLLRGLSVLGLVIALTLVMVAVATASPGVILDFAQCANGAPPNSNCSWLGGDLNANKATYYEGNAVPQRFLYDAACIENTATPDVVDYIPATEHLTIRYQTTNSDPSGAKHAFDYLTNYDYSEKYVAANDQLILCSGLPKVAVGTCQAWEVNTAAMVHDENLPSAAPEQPTSNRTFTVLNGTITEVLAPTISSGDYSKSSETDVYLEFGALASECAKLNTGGKADTRVLIAFGAHVAAEADWCPVTKGCGAFNISGSPYHVMTIDGGSRDNQMQADVIVVPSALPEIVIIKEAHPTTGQWFSFGTASPTGAVPLENFSLQGDLAGSNTRSFTGLTQNVWYMIEELGGSTGYDFQSVSCQPTGADVTYVPETTPPAAPYGTVQIKLNAGTSRVVCTYVNRNYTAVTMAGFQGRAANGQVRLDWQTGTETNNAGFNVLRSRTANGPYDKVNPQLIAASGDVVAGTSYSFADKPGYGRFYYKLEDIDMSGKATMHGPVEVTIVFPFRALPHQPAPPAQ